MCGGGVRLGGTRIVVRLSSGSAAGSRRGGFHVPGVYQALLERERAEDSAASRYWVNSDDHSQGFYARSTKLLEALEAGETVVVPVWFLGGHSVPCGEAFREYKLRLSPRPRHWVVAPNDVVRPAPEDLRIAWPGGVFR